MSGHPDVVDWNEVPRGPFTFWAGCIHPSGQPLTMMMQNDLTFERAVELFAQTLPPQPSTWASIGTGHSYKRIVMSCRKDGRREEWAGCSYAYDALAEIYDRSEVAWWATMAEHFDLQDAS